MGKIKGAAFREFIAFYARDFGAEELRRRACRMDASQRQGLSLDEPSLGILTSTWYDADVVHALLDALVRDLDHGARRRLAEAGARAVMDATLKGIYRTLFSMFATPGMYARLASTLWRSYYDSGEFKVVLPSDGHAICTIHGWEAHHAFICELNWSAASVIYESLGCTAVQTTRVSCTGLGSDHCEFVTRWRPKAGA